MAARNPILRPSPWAGNLLFNGNGRALHLDRPAPTLPASMGGNATPIVDQETVGPDDEVVVGYHAHLLAGGSPCDTVPERLRRITVEEAAALQSFPAGMAWAGSRSAQYRQIGNAVPPRLALAVAMALRASLRR